MSYLGLKSKIALTIDNKIVTDYEFDYAKETKDTITLWNGKILAWYDKKTCKCINQVADFSSLEFSNGIFVLGIGERKVAYNLSGKLAIEKSYTDIIPQDKYIEVKDGKKCGAYNYDGKLILPVKYETIYIQITHTAHHRTHIIVRELSHSWRLGRFLASRKH